MTKDERDRRHHRLEQANLPDRAFDMTIEQLGPKTGDAGQYFLSPTFSNDRKDGKLFCLTGNASIRDPLFMLVAKAFAYSELSTYFVSLHRLVYMIEDDDGRQKLERVDNLFIDHFEKTYRDGSGFPYTHRERAGVEEFLKARQNQKGKATFFSATKAWAQLGWWSSELIEELAPIMVEVQVAG